MSKTEYIIQELDLLNPSELETIYHELLKKINKADRVREILAKLRGKGEGVWTQDAQEYVNQLRENDRF